MTTMGSIGWVALGVGGFAVGIAAGLAAASSPYATAFDDAGTLILVGTPVLVMLGAAVASVRLPSGRAASIAAATFAAVALALGGSLTGYLLSPHQGAAAEPISATASGTMDARFDGFAVISHGVAFAECHSRPGLKEVGEVVGNDLGAMLGGTLQATLIPLAPDGDLRIWVEVDKKQQVVWTTQPTIELVDKLATSGRATFRDATLADDVAGQLPAEWPRTLSGVIEWTCGAWDSGVSKG